MKVLVDALDILGLLLLASRTLVLKHIAGGVRFSDYPFWDGEGKAAENSCTILDLMGLSLNGIGSL